MDIRERLEAFWSGQRPDRIPYTIYEWLFDGVADDPAWLPMFDAGLGVTYHIPPYREWNDAAEPREAEYEIDGQRYRHTVLRTPVGEIHSNTMGGWRQEYWLKTAEDYRVMTWIVEHTHIESNYHQFIEREHSMPHYGVALSYAGRSPIQTILVDYVGLENFAVHLFDLEDEMQALYDALLKNFRRRIEIAAGGPGRFVSVLENFTAETMGPKRFEQFHLPVYDELFGLLHEADKVVGTHYDGRLASCAAVIARSPIDLIESLTPPPEGDLTLAEARRAWPDKQFWSNISLRNYQLPPPQLHDTVLDLVRQGAVDGRLLAFEVSEELPANWRETIPVVLNALEETRT